jgi:hypothetical protein
MTFFVPCSPFYFSLLPRIIEGIRKNSMTKIIETLWGVTKSGREDSPWQRARAEYRELTGE